MFTLKLFFYISICIVFYTYCGYAIITLILLKFKKKTNPDFDKKEANKSVTLLIAAFNEEKIIESKILNCLDIDYPKSLLSIYIVTDGSTDKTTEIVKKYPEITLFHNNNRDGKVSAITRVMKFVTSEIVVFSDANTLLNKDSISKIVAHYSDPKVGGVAGEKKVVSLEKNKVAGEGEGLYWKYESFLKRIDSAFYSVVGAAGELFSVRTALYENPGRDTMPKRVYDKIRAWCICNRNTIGIHQRREKKKNTHQCWRFSRNDDDEKFIKILEEPSLEFFIHFS